MHIGRKIEMRVVFLGLDGAGKTSILFKLKQNEFTAEIPTIGFNVESLEYKNLKLTVWDVGGQHKLRPLWKHYYLNTQVRYEKVGIIYYVAFFSCQAALKEIISVVMIMLTNFFTSLFLRL